MKYLKYNILSAFAALFLMVMLLFLPLGFVLWKAVYELANINWGYLNTQFESLKDNIKVFIESYPFLQEHVFGLDSNQLLNEISFTKVSGMILKYTSTFGQSGLNFLVDGSLIIVFLFIFLCWGDRFYKYITNLLPFNTAQIGHVSHEVSGTLRIIFLSTLLNVVLQGSAFGIIAYIYGFNGVMLGIIYGICSLIPIVGGVIVWLPLSVILYFQDGLQSAIILALYSAIFIGFIIDNIVKTWLIGIVNNKLLPKPLEINEFLTFFAILAGLGAFGFWGIIIGPAINAFFIALLRVYQADFLSKDSNVS